MLLTTLIRPQGELAAIVRAFRGALLAVALFSCAINLLLLVPSIYMLQIYDRVLSSRSHLTLLMLTLMVVGLYLLEAALEFVRSRVLVRASAALDLKLSARVFDASFMKYLRHRDANPAQALADLANARQFLTGQGLFAFFDAPWTPIYLAVIFVLHPWLGAFAVLAAVVLLLMAWLNERLTSPYLAGAGAAATAAGQYADNNLRNAEAIEAMGMLGSLRERWFVRQARFLTLQARASDAAAAVGASSRFFRLAFQSGILGLGALLAIDGEVSPGGMIAASILLGRALSPVELGISTWRGFVSARGAFSRLVSLLATYPAHEAKVTLPRPQGDVTIEDLVLGAPGRKEPILKGIHLTVNAGTLIAVVGRSAAGKSTLARALVGVWAPQSGAVRLDGAEVHRWDRAQLGPWIGYLPQDVELFEGTLAENIARFGPVDAERVIRAARRAGVHDLVLHLPQGYDTFIGEGGVALSGGQRQRVALARALYGDPALVVLDEPNANLDDAGDAALIAALQDMKKDGRTVFVMTHRANVLAVADTVVVLANGAIQAAGPRDAVLKPVAPKVVSEAPREARRFGEDIR
jgi:ATP-binding cassette subfamily C exporter for protease/lipase